MKYPRDFSDPTSELRRHTGYSPGDAGKRLPGHRRQRLRRHRKELAGGHSNERQEMLGRLLFAFGFGRQLSQVLHHGVGVDLADGADLAFELAFALQFEFSLTLEFAFELLLAEQAADHIADGPEPALSFQPSLTFEFTLALQLEFTLELRQDLQFVFGPTGLTHGHCHGCSSSDHRHSARPALSVPSPGGGSGEGACTTGSL